jgi:hypothetical protein
VVFGHAAGKVGIAVVHSTCATGTLPSRRNTSVIAGGDRARPWPKEGHAKNLLTLSASSSASKENDQPGPKGPCIQKEAVLGGAPVSIQERRPGAVLSAPLGRGSLERHCVRRSFFISVGRSLRGSAEWPNPAILYP